MGLVGPGFVGAHHIDAVRRLVNSTVVAIAASSEASARRHAAALNVPKWYGTFEDLVADPDIAIVHNTTPNALHGPVIRAALAHRKHIVSDKPLTMSAPEAADLWRAAERAGVVHAVTFNYRGNPMVQQAREAIASGEIGPVRFVHGAYLQDWLLLPSDTNWRLDPAQGGESSAFADIGSHWCDLVQHVTGHRIVEVLADLTAVIPSRRSEDLATVLVRFANGAKGAVNVGQVCAGHKNDLWFEVNGASGSMRWLQERQNELWVGRRGATNAVIPKDPPLLLSGARPYARLPGGHQESWADAFRNVMHDIYSVIADEARWGVNRPPAFATFEDGYRAASIVDAVLDSHRRGGAWTKVADHVLA